MNNIYSAYHYACKTKADRERVEELAPKVIDAANKAVSGNIGDIKYTTRTTAPNGCFWCDGQTLTKTDLPKVYDMLKAGDLHYVDINTYNNVVELNGSCGFFGLDTANETFRVPLLADVYLKAGQEAATFGAESLPNITGRVGSQNDYLQLSNGAFYTKEDSTQKAVFNGETTNYPMSYFNASLSSSTYQDGAKVNPEHVKYRAYIVLFTAEKELSIVNWTNSLENKTLEGMARIDAKADSYLDKTQITNCITEIPQDIKLELKDGTLTLKAGSKVYVPNGKNADGSLRFGEVVIASDLTTTDTGNRILWFTYDMTANRLTAAVSSETGAPVSGTYKIYYDSSENKCFVSYASSYKQTSFPICIIKSSTTGITSIDQVFNGFGYIGSTVYALPGVKGLIPDGRNEDGSLRNIEYTSDKLTMQTLTSETTGAWSLGMWNDGGRVAGTNVKYDSYSNKMVGSTRGTCVELAYFTATNGVITSFTPKNTFHAVDYSALKAGAIIPTVVDFYQATEAWYRLWSDGTLEQGGRCWVGDVGSNGAVNFLKPFASTPMACGSKHEYSSFSESSGCIAGISATNITMGLRWGGDNSRGGRYCSFYAIGKAVK